MDLGSLSTTEIVIAVSAAVAAVAYGIFILAPAWTSYGRLWEKIGAGFLTLFMLATLLGIGVAIGAALVLSYDRVT